MPYCPGMSTLKITSKGQVTLRKEILEHLGAGPGAQVSVEMLPDGRVEIKAAPDGAISSVFGLLKRAGQPALSIEEMNEIARDGWSGRK
jgi:AbrB family looped-hinge helix DNA binding protein